MRAGSLRFVAVVFVLFGVCSAWGAVGVLRINPEKRYHAPYACASLECQHEHVRSPDGRWYCSKWPRKDIKFASVPRWLRNTRVIAGNICAIVALAFAVSMLMCGLLWLFGRWTPDKFRWWHVVACCAAPVVAWCLPTASFYVKQVYGTVPTLILINRTLLTGVALFVLSLALYGLIQLPVLGLTRYMSRGAP